MVTDRESEIERGAQREREGGEGKREGGTEREAGVLGHRERCRERGGSKWRLIKSKCTKNS